MRSSFFQRKASARRTRLCVETLEDRVQPATFVAPDLLTHYDTGDSAFDNVTSENRPGFAGTTTSPLGTSIALLVDDVVVATHVVATGGGGTFSVLPTTPLADGVHVARFRDSSTHALSNPLTFTIDATPIAPVDSTPPVISAATLLPDVLSPNGDGVQDVGAFRFTLSEPSYVAVHFLDVDGFDLGVIPLDLVDAGEQEFDLDVPQFPEGIYTIVLVASDLADNLGDLVYVPFTVDLTAPAAPTFALAPGQDTGVSSTDRITSIASPTFAGVGEPGATIEIREGSAVVGSTIAAGDGSWSITVPLTLGTHNLVASNRDAAGNSAAGAVQTFVIVATDATGPLDQAPVLTMPTTLTAYRNADVAFGSAFHVADADSANVLVLIGVDQGTIRLPSSAGLIFASGSDTSLLTIQGSIAAVNASLASAIFDVPDGYLGAIEVAVQVDDLAIGAPNGAQTADGALTISVVNRPPQIVASPSYAMNANATFSTTNLAASFDDLDGDALTISLVTPPAVGTLTLNADGAFTYKPPAGFAGTVAFVVQAFDGVDFSSPLTVTVLVRNVAGLRR